MWHVFHVKHTEQQVHAFDKREQLALKLSRLSSVYDMMQKRYLCCAMEDWQEFVQTKHDAIDQTNRREEHKQVCHTILKFSIERIFYMSTI